MHLSSLKTKAVSGVKWTAVQTLFVGVSSLLLQIIKAGFLSPRDFAALAIVTIFIGS